MRQLQGFETVLSPKSWQAIEGLEDLTLTKSAEPLLSPSQWGELRSFSLTDCPITWRTLVGLTWAKNLNRRTFKMERTKLQW